MPISLIDTHAHLNFQAFENDFGAVIKSARRAGVEKIINVGASLNSSRKALEIAQKYKCCYAAVGIHPHHSTEQKEGWKEKLKKLTQNPKVVAIGECGLDYHPYQKGEVANPKIQKEIFKTQLQLAQELNLPVIFHCRSAYADILDLLVSCTDTYYQLRGVFHCFSGNQSFLNKILEMGFYIGFCGNLTFKNAKSSQEIAKITPLERILIETDCPFLSPEPFRGLRNTPENVKLIAEFLAELRGITFEKICQITTENAKKVFSKIR